MQTSHPRDKPDGLTGPRGVTLARAAAHLLRPRIRSLESFPMRLIDKPVIARSKRSFGPHQTFTA